MTGVQEKSTTQRRRSGGARSTNARTSSSAGSSRRARQPAHQVLAELEPMISALIKENRELHRQIDKLSRQTVGAASGAVERTLRSIERRISSSLDGAATGRRRSARAASGSGVRRKVTDPELLERRRQALAKAREARAAKRASAQQ
jgi:hypothetical protein